MAIEVRNVRLAYGDTVIINDLSMSLPKGGMYSVIGPNGCGKSTLLKAIARTLKPLSGTICLDAVPLAQHNTKALAKKLAFLAQAPHIPEQFSVRELVSYGRYPHVNWLGGLSKSDNKIIDDAMDRTGIRCFAERELLHLSGGERQRVWLAMALAQEADILLLDEPTSYLDISHQLQILDLLSDLQRERARTILMVLHDLNQAARYSDYIFAMKHGALACQGSPSDVICEDVLAQVFSIHAKIFYDDDHDCPYFLPVRGLERKCRDEQ